MSGAAIYPVFVRNVSEEELWGRPSGIRNCTRLPCYNPETRTKLWGVVSSLFSVDKLLDKQNTALVALRCSWGLPWVGTNCNAYK